MGTFLKFGPFHMEWPKSLVPFSLQKKRSENAFLTLSHNHAEKQIVPFKTTVNWLFNIWCYLVIAFFDWKIGVFQQTVLRVYCILKLIQNNFVCLMEKLVQIFKCIISHSSAKSLVPPLQKFTIQNLDLILFPFWETKLA